MDGWIKMRRDELEGYEIIRSFIDGYISRKEAAQRLSLSERAVTNRANKVRSLGANGAFHGNRGRLPKVKKSEHTRHRYLAKRKELYFDFNVQHAWEMIQKEPGSAQIEAVSYSTFYKWCKEKSLLKHKQRRRKKPRSLRDRMPSEGQMIQLDGSPHKWNGTDEWCLIYAIDDATSDIPAGEFFDSETTIGCLKVLKRIIDTKGIPESFYVDKAGWGCGSKRVNFSHFDEACKQLDINIIYANSPEAKGRVERGNRTHQDRLPPLFRHLGIKSQTEATKYFNTEYAKKYWQEENTVTPFENRSSYRSAPKESILKEILSIKERREARNDGAISYRGAIYKVVTAEGHSPHKGTPVEIRAYLDSSWGVFVHEKSAKITLAPSNRQSNPRYLEQVPKGNKDVDQQVADRSGALRLKSA
jgi:hypothetical protein